MRRVTVEIRNIAFGDIAAAMIRVPRIEQLLASRGVEAAEDDVMSAEEWDGEGEGPFPQKLLRRGRKYYGAQSGQFFQRNVKGDFIECGVGFQISPEEAAGNALPQEQYRLVHLTPTIVSDAMQFFTGAKNEAVVIRRTFGEADDQPLDGSREQEKTLAESDRSKALRTSLHDVAAVVEFGDFGDAFRVSSKDGSGIKWENDDPAIITFPYFTSYGSKSASVTIDVKSKRVIFNNHDILNYPWIKEFTESFKNDLAPALTKRFGLNVEEWDIQAAPSSIKVPVMDEFTSGVHTVLASALDVVLLRYAYKNGITYEEAIERADAQEYEELLVDIKSKVAEVVGREVDGVEGDSIAEVMEFVKSSFGVIDRRNISAASYPDGHFTRSDRLRTLARQKLATSIELRQNLEKQMIVAATFASDKAEFFRDSKGALSGVKQVISARSRAIDELVKEVEPAKAGGSDSSEKPSPQAVNFLKMLQEAMRQAGPTQFALLDQLRTKPDFELGGLDGVEQITKFFEERILGFIPEDHHEKAREVLGMLDGYLAIKEAEKRSAVVSALLELLKDVKVKAYDSYEISDDTENKLHAAGIDSYYAFFCATSLANQGLIAHGWPKAKQVEGVPDLKFDPRYNNSDHRNFTVYLDGKELMVRFEADDHNITYLDDNKGQLDELEPEKLKSLAAILGSEQTAPQQKVAYLKAQSPDKKDPTDNRELEIITLSGEDEPATLTGLQPRKLETQKITAQGIVPAIGQFEKSGGHTSFSLTPRRTRSEAVAKPNKLVVTQKDFNATHSDKKYERDLYKKAEFLRTVFVGVNFNELDLSWASFRGCEFEGKVDMSWVPVDALKTMSFANCKGLENIKFPDGFVLNQEVIDKTHLTPKEHPNPVVAKPVAEQVGGSSRGGGRGGDGRSKTIRSRHQAGPEMGE